MKRAENRKGAALRLLKTAAEGNVPALALIAVCIVISALAGAAGPMFVQRLIDGYIAPLLLQDNPSYGGLLTAIAVMAAIYGAGVAAGFLYNRMLAGVAQGVLKKIRDGMFSHMQSLPVRYYDTHAFGDTMSLYTNDADTLREFVSQGVPQLLTSLVSFIAVVAAMLILNPVLCSVVAVCAAAMFLLSRKLSGSAAVHFRRQQGMIGRLNGYVEEMINGQKVVKVFCREEAVKKEFALKNRALFESSVRANRLTNILMPVMMQLGTIQYVLLALFGGFMAVNGFGGVTLGMIAAFLILSRAFSAQIGQISSIVPITASALAGAERIFAFLDLPQEQDGGYVTLVNAEYRDGRLCESSAATGLWAWKHPHGDGSVTYSEVKGDVRFFNVDFGYVPGKTVLKGVSIHAEPGQKVAFVGATGAGKTTVTNLINRFYDIADGKIRYDGININKIRKDDLRRSLGIVLQDTHLFTGTVAENIRYGRIDATKEEVVNAAALANAHDFIMRLPDGYDTVIPGDGSSLSGGQRQLIAIARAAVADPPVMILDEATSSIDTRTEALVQRGMDGLMRGRTVFVIAHRLSTVKNADVIIVLENGQVAERGSHDALMAKKGKYSRLYTGGLAPE